MNKTVKTALLVSVILIFLGGLIAAAAYFSGAATNLYWNGRGFTAERYNKLGLGEGQYKDTELGEVTSIKIDVGSADIEFKTAETFGIEAVSYTESDKIEVEMKETKLVVQSAYKKRMNFGIGWPDSKTGKVTVYIPKDAELENVDITTDFGEINIGAFKAEKVTISNDLGNLNAEDISADKMYCDLDAGDLNLKNVTAGSLSAAVDLGKCTLNGVTADTVSEIKVSAGDVDISNSNLSNAVIDCDLGKLTGKNVKVHNAEISNDAGDIDLAGVITGDINVECDLGSVTLDIDGDISDYNISGNTDLGSAQINGKKSDVSNSGASNKIEYDVDAGSVIINIK